MDAAFWNNRYTAPQYLYLYDETPNAFVTEMAPPIPAGPVLCLAEGDGRKVAISFVLGVFFDAKARPKSVGCGSNSQPTRVMSDACGDSFLGFTDNSLGWFPSPISQPIQLQTLLFQAIHCAGFKTLSARP